MEAIIRKLQKSYKKAMEEMSNWDQLQNEIISLFSNASSIIDRLQVLEESKNYGVLQDVPGTKNAVFEEQTYSLQKIFDLMREKMVEFESIVKNLEKISIDANVLIKSSPFSKQMQLNIGTFPTLKVCLNGLESLREMHHDEFKLKWAIISSLTCNCSSADIADLRRLLIEQPNIPKDEVESILDDIFAEEA